MISINTSLNVSHAQLGAHSQRWAAIGLSLYQCCIQFGSGGFMQSRLTLRASVCDGHIPAGARRVMRRNRANPGQGGLGEWPVF